MSVDTNQIDAEFKLAHQSHLRGDLEAARRAYDAILEREPDYAPAVHGLGNILLRTGHVEKAETAVRRALALDAAGIGYHTSLGNVLKTRGLYDEARVAYETELKLRPDFAIAHNQLGALWMMLGKPDDAVTHFQAAIKHAPTFGVAANNLGRALNNLDQPAEAMEAFRHALRIDDGFADAHANLAHVMRRIGDNEGAKRHFERAIVIDPRHGRAHRGLAQLALASGDNASALAALNEAARVDPTDATAYGLLGATYFLEGMPGRADQAYRRALDLNTDNPDVFTDAAAVSRALDDHDTARLRYKAALRLQTNHQEALAGLALLSAEKGDAKAAAARLAPTVNAGRATPKLLATYANILGQLNRHREGIALLESALQKRVPPDVAAELHFALGSLLDGEGSYDLAFFHFRRANEQRRTTYDPAAFGAYIDNMIDAFDAAAFTLPRGDWRTPSMVAVVGLPRSGVALTGRLMAAHPSVCVIGASSSVEHSILRLWQEADAVWPQRPGDISDVEVARTAQQAMSGRLPADCAQSMLLDTTWRNFFYLGVMASMFPDMLVIECTRDARDIARSSYFRDFSSSRGLPFSYDLGHIAAYVNGYRRLMAHWRETTGLRFHQLNYEQLVLEPAQECNKLSDFLGIDHDDAHFRFSAKSDASEWHIDTRSLRRFRHYRTHLEAFTDALDAPPEA